MIPLSLEGHLFTAKRTLSAFSAWWGTALLAALPAPARRVLQRPQPQLVIDLSRDEIVLTHQTAQRSLEILREQRGEGAFPGEQAALTELARRSSTPRVLVRLAEDQIIRIGLRLPGAADLALAKILQNEIERQTPFSRDQVYFDFRVRDRKKGDLSVELLVVRRGIVEHALALAAPLKASDLRIGVRDGAEIDFLRWTGQRRRTPPERRLSIALGLAAACLAAVAVYSTFERRDQEAAFVKAQAEAARRSFTRTDTLRREVERQEQQAGHIVRKRGSPTPLLVLQELTERLPDQIWIFHLHIVGREIRLSGYAPDASALIGLFATSTTFENARFRAPVTRPPNATVDRFDLSLDIRAGALP